MPQAHLMEVKFKGDFGKQKLSREYSKHSCSMDSSKAQPPIMVRILSEAGCSQVLVARL